MNKWEIDLLEEQELDESVQIYLDENNPLPRNIYVVGEMRPDDEKIYIHQDVYRKLHKFSGEDTSRERGSILLGQNHFFQGNHHVVVQGYLEARHTESSAATLTFTHETWEDIHQRKDEQFKSEKIVGWQHTHPGYGIFLSEYDIFIQENYFNLPWQLAYVIDPLSKEEGFFVWKEDHVCKLSGFYIYDEIGKKIYLPSQVGAESETEHRTNKKISVRDMIFLLVLAIAIVFSLTVMSQKDKIEKELEKAVITLANLANAEQESSNGVTNSKMDDLGNPDQGEDYVMFYTYTVKQGDTLEAICMRYGLNEPQNFKRVIKHNSIANPDLIYAGEELILPVK